ncbi:synaptotagmin-like protein 3 isoform X2 [Egretta garzetta]|uniref:synaptotagmin-like protein 3 isoform X2 n=1 Tax=Egretta garzetta TaxID=188379 RepID=UPI00163C44AE|nr:synaptotagmin-like protein 3 isoform X2 [Egretta garzetta]
MACEFNLNFLKELEREAVLEVLYRDQMVRKTEEDRIRKLKLQLQQLRWKGARNVSHEYQERSCARCQKSLGLLMNRGAVCNGCSHRVCSECRVCLNPCLWKCTVCYAHGDVKVKAGEWFFEERAKKYPGEGRHETVGAKLLKSYQKLSKISVVPPTPPPFTESTAGSNVTELRQSKSFNKSVENLFLSLTTHIKKISKSQNDMADGCLLTTDYGHNVERRKQRRSQSDTAINITSRVKSTPSLQQLITGAQNDSEFLTKRNCKEEEDITTSPTSDAVFCDGRKHGSLYSLSSTCTESGNFGKANITGEIEFAIRYIFKACILEVCIRGCKNLAYGEEKEKKRKCNPYVKVYLLPDKSPRSKRKTAVKKSTVDPVFNETLKYKIEYSQLGSRQLQISVWHAGALKYRVFLGEVLIPLAAWNFEDNMVQLFNWYQLKPKLEKPEDDLIQYSSELLVSARLSVPAQYSNFQFEGKKDQGVPNCQLQVMIVGAKNLPTLRAAGMTNSFVKGCLILPDLAEVKRKSPVLKKEACPQWKHLFVFDGVTPAQLQQSCLHLTVWDQSTFSSSDQFLGGAKLGAKEPLGCTDLVSQSVLQWQDVLRSPNTWMDFTLALHSNKENFKS